MRLPSHAGEDGSAALGPHDVALAGENGGGIIATVGLGGDPAFREGFGPKGRLFGTLVRVSHSGDVRVIADLAAYEAAVNPAGDIVDSNPFGLLRREERTIVTDAGGNSLLGVTDGGRVSHDRSVPLSARPIRRRRDPDARGTDIRRPGS